MSTATAKLLSEFEAPWDSGPLSDDAAAAAGDALAERFDEEERGLTVLYSRHACQYSAGRNGKPYDPTHNGALPRLRINLALSLTV